ncbi:outer membrane protein [Helicobacter suis]|uniref:outer membrane protein n=1 Tax=Helicobacter suis TaxID=104628 RepID=UPI0013D5C759|nr:outer membrane protein [Helicobacter suis]
MSLKRTFKSLTLSSLVAVSAMSVAQADEKNGFFLGLGYQQGRAGGDAYRTPLTSGMHLYGLGAQIGGVGFINKWFGGQIYGFFDYQNSPQMGPNSQYKWNMYTYGGAADMIVNFIATSPFSMGLVGGIQLAGNTWDFNGYTHTGFQFLFNVGGRIRIGDRSAIQAGIKFPMVPQKFGNGITMMRRYAWYVNYVFTF